MRRHALRLAVNLHTALTYGRFNPTLTETEADWVNRRAASRRLVSALDAALSGGMH